MDDTWNIFGVIAIHIFPRWILHFVIVWNGYEVTAVVSSNQGNAFLLDLSSCFQSNTFSFVRCYTWIELDTIELHAFCVQVARLYLILIGRIQCWKYFIINGQVRLISSDLFTDCVNTGCRIEVMSCSYRVKIMQITQPTNWHALVCLFIISFALRYGRGKIRQEEASPTQRKHSGSEMY